MLKILFCLGLLTNSFCLLAKDNWNLNDVSYLFKIPTVKTQNTDSLLGPKSSGDKGALLPLSWYERIPTLNITGSGKMTAYESELKVVSVRIDPCPNSIDPKNCSPEIRLVWQPISFDQDVNHWVAQDAALHTFYKLSSAQFGQLKKDLWSLKLENKKSAIDTTKLPLGVHPAFLNQNIADKFNLNFQKILLHNCGEQNLVKITFMSLLTQNIWWRFGGIEKVNGEFSQVKVPRTNMVFQDIFNSAIEENSPVYNMGKEMDAVFNILPDEYPEADNLLPMINNGYRFNDDRDHDVFVEKLKAVERFRNPHSTNPTNLDCASCHFADGSKFYAGKRFSDLNNFKSADTYKNPNPSLYDLKNTSIGLKGTRLVRAFGYFEASPSISQRAIHDSAETANWMNVNP